MEQNKNNEDRDREIVDSVNFPSGKITMANEKVYIAKEQIGSCSMCGSNEDLRFGWCWDCAEAQNIIATGKTMSEDDVETDIKFPIKEVNKRLKMLIEKGWHKGLNPTSTQ